VTQDQSVSRMDKFDLMKTEIGEELFHELLLRNQLDFQLYNYALGVFDARLEKAGLNKPGKRHDDQLHRSVA